MSAISIVIGVYAGFWAGQKGYQFWCFCFTGLLGLISLMFLPNLHSKDVVMGDKRHTFFRRGNTVGSVLTGINVVATIGLLVRSAAS